MSETQPELKTEVSQPVNSSEGEKVLRQFEPAQSSKKGGPKFLVIFGVVVLIGAGVFTGWSLSGRQGEASESSIKSAGGDGQVVNEPNEVGVKDNSVFTDSAQGRLIVNDFSIVQEGSHLLERPGGPSQTAYLTSSIVDLSQFEGKCVEIKGETFAGQKAGWLMDVGWLKVLDQCPEGL